ncbi:hypothetical protein C9374_003571 [Naegleria lovaniensis]|uniref:Uncharacterized protein n=1 Tax=Naegleria lovaniensis TaxID=51637 RepID=A0AA88H7S7_NAELO|nr:uncharacterized protein C9374_003571 [Naegleria lovaniensis]KAG2393807.1 hypothetical protein C9374_003571 [Naegleria lovaniensis]
MINPHSSQSHNHHSSPGMPTVNTTTSATGLSIPSSPNSNNNYSLHNTNNNVPLNHSHSTIVSKESCLSPVNHHHSESTTRTFHHSEDQQAIASNNEVFFFVMTPDEKNQFMLRVDQYVQERRPHEALSLLAHKAKNLQDHLQDLMNQQESLHREYEQVRRRRLEYFDRINNIVYHQDGESQMIDFHRWNQLSMTIDAVKKQLVELMLKKVQMLLPMQLEQEAERDLKIIFNLDPQNEMANQYVSILEQQLQEKAIQEEEEKLEQLQRRRRNDETILLSDLDSGTLHERYGVVSRKRTNTLYDFNEDIEELECPLCYRVFYEPVTLSCGHTFDRSCICRVHDYSDKCPLCRQTIHVVPYDYPVTVVINELCQKYCKQQYEQRKKEMEEENGSRQLNINHIPIFVLDFVLYPHTLLPLHIFEPRYRLMMRRCMSGSKCFGLVCCGPNRNGDIAKYGCIAKITSFKLLPDGRSIIETVGTDRFKILEKWDTDGYICAKVQLLKDKTENEIHVMETGQFNTNRTTSVPQGGNGNSHDTPISSVRMTSNDAMHPSSHGVPSSSSTTSTANSFWNGLDNVWHTAERMTLQQLNEQLYQLVDIFLQDVGPETKQTIIQKVGPYPKENEPEKLSFWVSAMLPLTTQLKLDLLAITNTKERLRVLLSICKQIAQSQQSNCATQ